MDDSEKPLWLDVTEEAAQADDLITRQTVQELRRRQIETTHEYSLKLLDAEFLDRQREREHLRAASFTASMLVGFLSLLLTAAICYALYLNKDQLVMEFLKAILFLVTGGVGGYSLKTVRDKSEASKQ